MSIDKKAQLRKHKFIATGLFFFMMLLYFILVYAIEHQAQTWMYYVKAFAEAGMVGALADWFAVTALFKYPMGLQIPHTNLIVNNKNAIGENLGSFVTDNFLTPETIRPYIEKLEASAYINDWLEQEKNIHFLSVEVRGILSNVLKQTNDQDIIDRLSVKGIRLLEDLKLEQWATKALLYLVEQNEHNALLSILLPKAKEYVEQNRELIYQKVIEKQPILGLIGGKSVTNQLISGITTFIQDIEKNEKHELREELTLKLLEIAHSFSTDSSWKLKFDDIKNEFISEEKLQLYITEVWMKMKQEWLDALHQKDSTLSIYIVDTIKGLAHSFITTNEMQHKVDTFVKQIIYKVALRKRHEIGKIITTTVSAWDGKELSEKLELEVGKDLQYIRVNGTLVGGLVGLLIYAITHLFFYS